MTKPAKGIFVCLLCILGSAARTYGQSNGGTIHGAVLDPSGAAINGASVEIQNPVSQFKRTVLTDAKGNFEFDNVPLNNYHTTISALNFETTEQDVAVHSAVPVELKVTLKLGAATTTVDVTESGDLVETDSTAHTDVDRQLFEKLPLASNSSPLSSLLTRSSPGITEDSNGQMHGLGDHASNSLSVDDQPITDQQSKIFSNQLPLDSVQSMEVIEGAPPAEFGGKTSVVIVVNTRSGLGATQPHGEVTASYGTFGTGNGGFDLAYGKDTWGNFISANGLDTGRFLDGPEYQIFHDHGNQQNIFDRIDLKPTQADSINLNLSFTRSWFQTPNSYDAQNATAWSGLIVNNGGLGPNGVLVGSQDQRSQIRTFNVAPAWTRLLNAHSVLTFGGYLRQDQYNYYPSRDPFADYTPDLQSSTIAQNRRLTNAGVRSTLSYANGVHNVKAGVLYQHTFLTENDSFGIVDPGFNAVCLNPDGSANTNPAVTSPSQCTGGLQANPAYSAILAPYDLTRPLPNAGPYTYRGHADIKELALYIQDTITFKNLTLNLGIRGDKYNGLTSAGQAEPRVGAAYNFKPTNTVLRVSYARTMETPFNENLIVASEGCNDPVIQALQAPIPGGACITTAPLSPGTRNEYHVGLEQAISKYLVLDAEYIWKYTNRAFDFSVLGNTPITYPIEWSKSKIPGYAGRASVPSIHGFSAYVVFSSVAARFFTPQVSGIGATPTGASVFRIDHDELFNQSTHLQYQPKKNYPWIAFNWRYDSGEVAGAVPCAGGNCANGPNGTSSMVDVSDLTPDQQYEAGLFCGSVYATPLTPISATGLCPASQYGSKYLTIPAAGTENDDHNPPRIAPRNLFDISIGDDNLFKRDRYKVSARLTVVNLMNTEAVYNFLSTFSGTHYVTPRAITATLGFHF